MATLVVTAVAVLVSWRHPGVSGTLWLAAGPLLAVGLVELLSSAGPGFGKPPRDRLIQA